MNAIPRASSSRHHLVALAALALTVVSHAETPGVYAIRGARVVTGAGAPIESGTIVVRDGLIDAVGPDVVPPPDAETIDGGGLTVYPGLIDLGNTRVAYQLPMQPPLSPATTADLDRWKRTQVLRPQARAADAVKVDDADLTRLAAAGITSVLAVPSGDVFAGQSALISVMAPPERPPSGGVITRNGLVILRSPVALHVSFPSRPRPAGNAYPSSLMGSIAFVRQAFLDAQHYGLARARYNRLGTGDKPSDDSVLEALQPAVEGTLPVAFEANGPREILRALGMAREMKLDPIVVGAHGSMDVVADLQAARARVIYSLNYPKRSPALPPDADEPLRELRARADAPRAPAMLAAAGVPFAFASAGLTDPKDVVRNAAGAVRAGLAPDSALRALTLDAARIAGIADRLGTIERGKIANLLLTTGDLFAADTHITRVFVDGRPVSLNVSAPPARPSRRIRGTEY